MFFPFGFPGQCPGRGSGHAGFEANGKPARPTETGRGWVEKRTGRTPWKQSLQETTWQGDEQQLEQLVELWQHQKLTIASLPVSKISQISADYVASVWLAGEQLPAVYQLYNIDQQYYLLDKRLQRVFELEQADAAKLFPLYPF